jgi:hypothetical protein
MGEKTNNQGVAGAGNEDFEILNKMSMTIAEKYEGRGWGVATVVIYVCTA